MNKSIAALIIIAIVAIVIVLCAIINMWLWNWVIPDVFSGAVAKGILPASITLWQSIKLTLLCWLFAGAFFGARSGSK